MYRQNRNKKYLENLGQEENYCLTVDCYPSVDDEILDLIKEIYKPDFVIKSEDVFYEKDELNKMMKPFFNRKSCKRSLCIMERWMILLMI